MDTISDCPIPVSADLLKRSRRLSDVEEPEAKRHQRSSSETDTKDGKPEASMAKITNHFSPVEAKAAARQTTPTKLEASGATADVSVGASLQVSPDAAPVREEEGNKDDNQLANRPANPAVVSPMPNPSVTGPEYFDDGPLVYAEGRQPMCSALPYFKAYQGGTYTSKENNITFVKGCLVDGEARPRDVLGAQVVITTV